MHPTLMLAATIAVTMITVLLGGCGGGGAGSSGASDASMGPTDPPGAYGSVQFAATTDKSVYTAGEPVTITFTIRNAGTQTLAYDHTPPDADAVVRQGGVASPRVWQWSVDKSFSQVLQHDTLAPGQTVTYTMSWPQQYQNGLAASPGQYTIDTWAYICPGVTNLPQGSDIRELFGAKPVQITIQ